MKPGLSLARIGVRRIRSTTSVVASSASGEESAVATTSTSFIRVGGLKKCIPTTRSGPGVRAAMSVTRSEEVLEARIVSGPQASARSANRPCFRSSRSGAASTTKSHPASPSIASTVVRRPLARSASSSLQALPAPFASASDTVSSARPRTSGSGSWIRVG